MVQDLPPKGGYAPIQFRRNLPSGRFRPVWGLVGVGAVVVYGWYKLAKGNRELIELGREKVWSRFHLLALLEAETDRDQVRRHLADLKMERELTGKQTKVYNSDRFVWPTYAVIPEHPLNK